MKKQNKFDQWIDDSIAKFMKKTDEIDLEISREQTVEKSEVPIFPIWPSHAEASDVLSINEWLLKPLAPREK